MKYFFEYDKTFITNHSSYENIIRTIISCSNLAVYRASPRKKYYLALLIQNISHHHLSIFVMFLSS